MGQRHVGEVVDRGAVVRAGPVDRERHHREQDRVGLQVRWIVSR